MIFGYARVSTAGQASSGNSLEEQVARLREAGAVEIVQEHFTGTTTQRPEFKKLLDKLTKGDTLVVTKLDRFARSAIEGVGTIQELLRNGVAVNILNMGLIDNRPASKLMVTMMLAFAEFERDMIVERTQEGKRIAKMKQGFHEGRPRKFVGPQINHALQLLEQGNSYTAVEKMTGISKSTLVRRVREKRAAEKA